MTMGNGRREEGKKEKNVCSVQKHYGAQFIYILYTQNTNRQLKG